jgi:N-acetylneuraminate synthase/N,N'-diacetyllegionaminate synthase
MDYGCTTYTTEDMAMIDPEVDFHKISSFENRAFARREGKPVLIGAGMLTHEGLTALVTSAAPNWRILQCTSSYPADVTDLHLATIRQYRLAGLSDHSRLARAGGLAVAAGAAIIESHLRLYTCRPENPDYPVSRTPAELEVYVGHIREAERAMGYPLKAIQPCEQAMLAYKVDAV